jgi:glucose-1-phosphate thymidylyltransferase
MTDVLKAAVGRKVGATIFAYEVNDPGRYGVVWFDKQGHAVRLEEKPEDPSSRWAVTGLYVCDNRVVEIASGLEPSARGEVEIVDVHRAYLARGELSVERLGRGFAWLDTGTCDSLLEAAEFVRTIQHRQSTAIGCLEEIAFRQGWIDFDRLRACAFALEKTRYGSYLRNLVEDEMRK